MADTLDKMSEFKIMKGFSPEIDQLALTAISNLNFSFKPAEQQGKPVESTMVIPIIFEPKSED